MDIGFEDKLNHNLVSLGTRRHAHIIYGLIRWIRPDISVEIGSFQGYMTAVMAKAIKDNHNDGILIAVDDFSLQGSAGAANLHNNLLAMGVVDCVSIQNCKSTELDLPKVDLALIDGDHSYEGVKHDFELCYNHGANCIIIHDVCSWWGPNEFVKMDLNQGIMVPFDEGLFVWTRPFELPEPMYSKDKYPKGEI